ncbi:MAG TPA: carbohydrate ABC transporter permease [Mycobacteriales bacterium]|nr:carbohydrate ABC transporter permease [Mycobacteriales bacterium]
MRLKLNWRYIPLLLWSIFVLFPLYWVLVTAFKDNSSIYGHARWLPWVDFHPKLLAWRSILGGDNSVLGPLGHSLVIVAVSTLIALVIGSMAAYGLVRFPVKVAWMKSNDVSFFIISQRMMPPVVVVMAFFVLYRNLHLLDSLRGMIIIYTGFALPLVVWFMQGYFRQIPVELEEAALIDGAGRGKVFWRIALPLTTPGIVATFLLAFSFSWNEFLFAVMLTQTRATTLPIVIAQQQGEQGTSWWNICAISLISIVPMVAAAIFLQKRLVTGLLGGSLQ